MAKQAKIEVTTNPKFDRAQNTGGRWGELANTVNALKDGEWAFLPCDSWEIARSARSSLVGRGVSCITRRGVGGWYFARKEFKAD